jgi:tRNA/tmRNA/rRNA uracil-C5-methylase (TrmA/RlmC/RlmD family)
LSTALLVNQEITLTIASLAHGGSGVGRLNDFVFFIPLTCPGDTVKARITRLKKNYAEAELIEILEASPHRVKAPCPVFGQCGGCQWQHVNYEEQLHQKQMIVEQALSRMAKEEGAAIFPVIPSPDQFNYRNRVQFHAEGAKVGFYQRLSHTLIEFKECLIAEKPINEELAKIKIERKAYLDNEKIEVSIAQDKRIVRSLSKAYGEEAGFSQVNTRQNLNLQTYIQKLIGKPSGSGDLLDLYCGNGNFSFTLNELGWSIHGVDSNREAIITARKMALKNMNFTTADVSSEVKNLAIKEKKFETIVLDPPRIGADEKLWENLSRLGAQKIIYISCNPATFARDWARLKSIMPVKLISVQPFDMFPQTFHVELVAQIHSI